MIAEKRFQRLHAPRLLKAERDVLFISNALGESVPGSPRRGDPAFQKQEIETVRVWVVPGGALLLVADHAPADGRVVGSSCESIRRRARG